MSKITAFPKERIEKVAKMYKSSKDAAAALGITPGSFSRLCSQYGIESPPARQRRKAGKTSHGQGRPRKEKP